MEYLKDRTNIERENIMKKILTIILITSVIAFSNTAMAGNKKKDKKTNWSTFEFSDLVKGKVPGPVKKKY